jgi:hypothetical protein
MAPVSAVLVVRSKATPCRRRGRMGEMRVGSCNSSSSSSPTTLRLVGRSVGPSTSGSPPWPCIVVGMIKTSSRDSPLVSPRDASDFRRSRRSCPPAMYDHRSWTAPDRPFALSLSGRSSPSAGVLPSVPSVRSIRRALKTTRGERPHSYRVLKAFVGTVSRVDRNGERQILPSSFLLSACDAESGISFNRRSVRVYANAATQRRRSWRSVAGENVRPAAEMKSVSTASGHASMANVRVYTPPPSAARAWHVHRQ